MINPAYELLSGSTDPGHARGRLFRREAARTRGRRDDGQDA